jgi:hypothetical protein
MVFIAAAPMWIVIHIIIHIAGGASRVTAYGVSAYRVSAYGPMREPRNEAVDTGADKHGGNHPKGSSSARNSGVMARGRHCTIRK